MPPIRSRNKYNLRVDTSAAGLARPTVPRQYLPENTRNDFGRPYMTLHDEMFSIPPDKQSQDYMSDYFHSYHVWQDKNRVDYDNLVRADMIRKRTRLYEKIFGLPYPVSNMIASYATPEDLFKLADAEGKDYFGSRVYTPGKLQQQDYMDEDLVHEQD